jgi:multidrug resistance efflux pump
MKPTPNEIRLERANRRIERRDRKIAGLQRKIKRLENALAWRSMDLESLSRNVRREVVDALCNVRMIPIHGWTRDQVIAEVRTIPTNPKQ